MSTAKKNLYTIIISFAVAISGCIVSVFAAGAIKGEYQQKINMNTRDIEVLKTDIKVDINKLTEKVDKLMIDVAEIKGILKPISSQK